MGFNSIAKLLPPAYDDDFLLHLLKALGYKLHTKGLCYGIAHLAKQAIICREIDKFNNRLKTLFDLFYRIESDTLRILALSVLIT